MKKIVIIFILLLVVIFVFMSMKNNNKFTPEKVVAEPLINPIEHASFVMEWGDLIIYNDPIGGVVAYNTFSSPDLILLSDVHSDHLDVGTLEELLTAETTIVAPQAVADELTESLLSRTVILANGEDTDYREINIEAVPMYNLPERQDAYHLKGRGNGYVLDWSGMRIYIAGDTADIPEMRALKNIHIAFVPMNLPYTMTVEAAADAVLDFAPDQVIPYHYRGQEGLSDIDTFRSIVKGGNSEIEVLFLKWYSAEE